MKKLLLTLVFMIVSLCALAQPDYVGQAPAYVHKYYPQYEEYFKTVFDKIKTLKPHSIALLNEEIHENMELFEEDIKSEKDKRTIILMALEMLIVAKKEFTKAKDVQGPQGDNDYKYEIAESIEDDAIRRSRKEYEQSKKEYEQSKKEYDQAKKRYDFVHAKNVKLKELTALIKRLDEQGINSDGMEQITKKMEEYFTIYNDEELKNELDQNKVISIIIKHYINYNKQIGRTPSALGQKFINEYNRIIKQ